MERLITNEIEKLGQLFKDNGFELRIVGGAVRDVLLNLEPKDIDFCTDATPQEMIALITDNGMKYLPTGLQHGTISVVGKDELYEITTLRIDKETDGRHAEVEFTIDFELDAARRDFTFNAMSVDMEGNLYDYFNGQFDLEANRVMFVGNVEERITEDYLRILRFFRFLGRMDRFGMPNAETIHAFRNNASGLSEISSERIWTEMKKILTGKHTYSILWLMDFLNVSDVLDAPKPNPMLNHDTVGTLKTNNPITKLAFLTTGVNMHDDWKLSKKESELLEFLHVTQVPNLHNAKVMLTNGTKLEFLQELFLMVSDFKTLEKINNWAVPKFPVTGKDLLDAGFAPGPAMGDKLSAMKVVWQASEFVMLKEDLLK